MSPSTASRKLRHWRWHVRVPRKSVLRRCFEPRCTYWSGAGWQRAAEVTTSTTTRVGHDMVLVSAAVGNSAHDALARLACCLPRVCARSYAPRSGESKDERALPPPGPTGRCVANDFRLSGYRALASWPHLQPRVCTSDCFLSIMSSLSPEYRESHPGKLNYARPPKCLPDYVPSASEFST